MGKTQGGEIVVIDSHTAGEPTRVVVSGGPDLGEGDLRSKVERMRECEDWLRTSLCLEPRASEAAVGALLCAAEKSGNAAGVIFFNNRGYIGMCGHGTIGLVATLEYLGRMEPGEHRIETTVGEVGVTLHGGGRVTVTNVASYRYRAGVEVDVAGYGKVRGDIAWGGNWFFLVSDPGIGVDRGRIDRLMGFGKAVRAALGEAGITGADGAEVDHIEVFGHGGEGVESRNFVLCPGGEYDRSPCGTGTSAKLACLYEDGELKEGEKWRQAGILGGVFEGSITRRDGKLFPQITGTAYVTGETRLVFTEGDPFRHGIL